MFWNVLAIKVYFFYVQSIETVALFPRFHNFSWGHIRVVMKQKRTCNLCSMEYRFTEGLWLHFIYKTKCFRKSLHHNRHHKSDSYDFMLISIHTWLVININLDGYNGTTSVVTKLIKLFICVLCFVYNICSKYYIELEYI